MKRLWLVRLGKNGEQEPHALEESELVLGFRLDNLSGANNRDAILDVLKRSYPNEKPKTQLNFAAQVNQFCNQIQTGDLVVTPLKTTSQIGIAEVSSEANLNAEGRVSRKIKWLRQDLPRETFRQDLLYSFGAFMTVCEISRNGAIQRVEVILKTGRDPGFEGTSDKLARPRAELAEVVDLPDDEPVDVALFARDQIERRIASAFVGHDFTRLVAEILKAQGYLVNVSPPGADNGIDIVAGRGGLGFDEPRLVVQVKSGNITVDQPTLQALIGAVQDTRAGHGLIVSWGGFKRTVDSRRNELYFRIRFWGRAEIIDALLDVYDRLPEELRAELPLRRIWALVPESGQTTG
jgi:restriction system protein